MLLYIISVCECLDISYYPTIINFDVIAHVDVRSFEVTNEFTWLFARLPHLTQQRFTIWGHSGKLYCLVSANAHHSRCFSCVAQFAPLAYLGLYFLLLYTFTIEVGDHFQCALSDHVIEESLPLDLLYLILLLWLILSSLRSHWVACFLRGLMRRIDLERSALISAHGNVWRIELGRMLIHHHRLHLDRLLIVHHYYINLHSSFV